MRVVLRVQSIRIGAVLALAAVLSIGCVGVNEQLTGRDLECGTTPEDLCVRAADLAEKVLAADIQERFREPELVTIFVSQISCAETGVQRPVVRCWTVEVSGPGGGIGIDLFELPDGGLSASRK